MCLRSFPRGSHEVCPNEDWVALAELFEQRERERNHRVLQKAMPKAPVQASWRNRPPEPMQRARVPGPGQEECPQCKMFIMQGEECMQCQLIRDMYRPLPKADPVPASKPAPKPAPEAAPKAAVQQQAAEMMIIDDEDQWGPWPKPGEGKNYWKKQRKRERQREAQAEEERLQEIRDRRIAEELEAEAIGASQGNVRPEDRISSVLNLLTLSDPNSPWHCSVCMCSIDHHQECCTLPCFHRYHKDCILTWFSEGSMTCPTCRQPVANYDITARPVTPPPSHEPMQVDEVGPPAHHEPEASVVVDDTDVLPTVSAAAGPPSMHIPMALERDRLAREKERRDNEEKQNLLWQNQRLDEELQKALKESLKDTNHVSGASSSSASGMPTVTVPEPLSAASTAEEGEADDVTITGSEKDDDVKKTRISKKRPSSEYPHYQ